MSLQFLAPFLKLMMVDSVKLLSEFSTGFLNENVQTGRFLRPAHQFVKSLFNNFVHEFLNDVAG
jgi:hypothetical protein